MALKTRYYTVNGQIIGEKAGNGVRTDYMVDPLGSVIGTTNKDASVTRSYRYKPFGTPFTPSGSGSDPKFRWVGRTGYKFTNRANATHYIVARSYGQEEGSWTSVDPLWPNEYSYSYAGANPITLIDPAGLAPCTRCSPSVKLTPSGVKCDVRKSKGNPNNYDVFAYKCMKISCKTEGSNDSCTLTQYITARVYNAGKLVQKKDKEIDRQIGIPCPGSDFYYDGPGFSLKKDLLHDPCTKQKPRTIPVSQLLSMLPIVAKISFIDECKCAGGTSTTSWSFTLKIDKDKKGNITCNYS